MAFEEIEIRDGIQKIHCETCADLLEYLRPSHEQWLASNGEPSWIFRGHYQEDWSLEPPALRNNIPYLNKLKAELASELIPIPYLIPTYLRFIQPEIKRVEDVLFQTLIEKEAIHRFIDAVNQVGLPIPDDGTSRDFHLTRDGFLLNLIDGELNQRRIIPGNPGTFLDMYDPTPLYLDSDVVALAQHHGIPTRLLDWSENALKAAYFAATKIGDKKDNEDDAETSKNIVIWAIHQPSLGMMDTRLVNPRRSRIGFLHAQEGVFTYDINLNHHYINHGNWRTLEEIVKNRSELKTPLEPEYYLRKITFPVSKTEELLIRLKAHKIEKRYLMPTYDNIADSELTRNREAEFQEMDKIRKSGLAGRPSGDRNGDIAPG